VLLSVVMLGCKSNLRFSSYFDPRPPDILGLEDTGVLEEGPVTLVLRPPFNDLAPPIVTPAFRFKGVNRRRGSRHREESSGSQFVHRLFISSR
jgi:hypothetical protein